MRDPYAVLGVPRNADAAAIKAAYRKLAKTWHPDRHPGDAEAERRFKEIGAAYNLLADPGRRRRFDAGEIDAEGQERGFRGFGGGRGFEGVFDRAFGGGRSFSGGSIDDILGDLFGARAGGRGARQRPPP
ncbi:MAG TPA: DnaJ domain-containing protein, partial [Geminicoccaceae bacterium]|nr:DnaJ domain-containing protein [Geminicoccaceae bacterium]